MPSTQIADFSRSFATTHADVLAALDHDSVAALIAALIQLRASGSTLFLAGNGGSAATASHMVIDLTKGASEQGRAPVRCVCLADCVPAITAIANDVSYDEIFSAQLRSLARSGDALLVVSGSGRSPNVLRALEEARSRGMTTLGLFGMGGGPCLPLCDTSVVVASDDYGVIEDVHMVIGHLATAYLRAHD